MRYTALLLLPLVVCGCNKGDNTIDTVFDACAPLAIVPDAGATEAQRARVAAGVALWNGIAATALTLTPADGVPQVPLHFQSAAPAFFGYYDDVRGEISINNDLTNDHECAVTVAHEVGHAFGLPHTEREGSVMVLGNLASEPNAGDVAALAALWGTCGQP